MRPLFENLASLWVGQCRNSGNKISNQYNSKHKQNKQDLHLMEATNQPKANKIQIFILID